MAVCVCVCVVCVCVCVCVCKTLNKIHGTYKQLCPYSIYNCEIYIFEMTNELLLIIANDKIR